MRILFLFNFIFFFANFNSLQSLDFYVDGSNPAAIDTNPGTKTLPLKTIDGAKNLIRIYKQTNTINENITVWIRNGTYHLNDTVAFTILDSGTVSFSIIYQAYPGENVVLTGKKNIASSSFQTVINSDPLFNQMDVSAKGVVKSINLNDFGITNYGNWSIARGVNSYLQLFINDQWMPIARWPDEGESRDIPILKNKDKVVLTGVTTPAVAGEYLKSTIVDGVNSFMRNGLVDGKQYYLYRNSYTNAAGQIIRRWLLCTQTSGYPANGVPFWYVYYDYGSYSDYPILPLTPMALTTGTLRPSAIDSYTEFILQNGFIGFQKADTADSFNFLSDRMKRWSLAKDMIAHGFFNWLWDDSLMEIKSIDTVTRKITLKSVPTYGIEDINGGRLYVFNMIEEITKPGEWYLDKTTGKLYIWPTSNFDSSKISITVLNTPLVSLTDTKYFKLKNINFDGSRNHTISIVNGQGIDIDECQMLGNGTVAISMLRTTDSIIQNCIISGAGGSGIDAHGCGSRPLLITSNNIIRNCELSQLGKRKFVYSNGVSIDGIGSDSNVGFNVLNNEFHDIPHTATRYTGNEHKILRNKIYNVCSVTSDTGAINTGRDWSYRGNIVKNNFIFNMTSIVGAYVHGIYFDDAVAGNEASGNILYNISGYGLLHGGGRDIIVKNNVFYKCGITAYFVDDRGQKFINNKLPNDSWNFYDRMSFWGGFDYQAEPWKSKYPLLNAIPKDWTVVSNPINKWLYPGGSIFSGNLGYQNGQFYTQHNYITPGEDLKKYLQEYSNNIENSDPLFKNKDLLNFELLPNSPAFTIPGFEAIPFNQIGIQYPIAVSAGANGVITPNGNVLATKGFDQIFSITPATGYLVETVLVDGVNVGAVNSYTFLNVTKKHTVSTTFKLKTYTITASSGVNGSISPAGSVITNHGANQVFTITPATNYLVDTVLVDGVNIGSVASYTFSNVTAAHTISATFKIKTYSISASTGVNGSISPVGNIVVNHGANQTFTLTPSAGYQVNSVLVDGVSAGAVTSFVFTNVTSPHTISVSFKIKTYLITSSTGVNGNISPSGSVVINHGANQTFTMIPLAGYQVNTVLVDGVNAGSATSYTFSNVTAPHTINVSFKTSDVMAPTIPAGLVSSVITTTSFTLSWTASTDAVGVTGYKIFKGGVQIGTSATNSFAVTGLTASTTYSMTVSAYDAAGNNSAQSTAFSVKTSAPADTTAPTIPTALAASAITTTSFTLSWTTSTDAVAVTGYKIFKNSVQIGTSATNSFAVTGLTASTTYSMTVSANDAVGNNSAQSTSLSVKTSAPADTTAPTVPTALAASAITTTSFTLSWTASTDVVGVTGYKIFKSGVQIGTSANNSFVATALTASTTYSMTVSAYDAAGNNSAQSTAFSITTSAATDTTAPTIPAGLAASTITITSFALSWTASTDAIGVSGYKIFKDGVQIGTSAINSFFVTGLAASTTYAMTVSAFDTAGNNSAQSAVLSGKTSVEIFTIMSFAGANGSISPSETVLVSMGLNQTFTMNPSTGYQVKEVLVDGVSVGAVSSYTFSNVTAPHTISVSYKLKTFTITGSSEANGSIAPTNAVINHGSSQTFTMTPSAGYQVSYVLVDGVSVGSVTAYTFNNVTAPHTIAAFFQPTTIKTYSITASAGINGGISPTGSVVVKESSSQIFTMTPAVGYQVDNILVDGASMGSVTTFSFNNIMAAHSISVTFKPKIYTITASANVNGIISPAGSLAVNHGTNQTFTITPSPGYQVDIILINGVITDAVTTYTFSNVMANHTISVSFKPITKTHTITASSDINGSISPSGSILLDQGSKQIFTMKPSFGYQVKAVLVDGVSIGVVTRYIFKNVSASHTISVSYKPVTILHRFSIVAPLESSNGYSAVGSINITSGENQSFSITPALGYQVAKILVDGVTLETVKDSTFSTVELIIVSSGTSSKKNSSSTDIESDKSDESSGKTIVDFNRIDGAEGSLKINYEAFSYTALYDSDFSMINNDLFWPNEDASHKTIEFPIPSSEIEADTVYSVKILSIEKDFAGNTPSSEVVDGEPTSASEDSNNSNINSNGGKGGCSYSPEKPFNDQLGELMLIFGGLLILFLQKYLKKP